MNVWCVNEECEQYHAPKSNPFELPAAEIVCGGCGGTVEETAEEPAP